LGQADNLAAEGRLDEAQHALLNLQAEFPDSAEIDPKLLAFDRQIKVNRFVAEGQQAFDQGEFGEAVRIFSEAQEFAPSDARVRDLKVRAVQERDRLRRVREAISSGQRAMRQGDSTVAEREYQRALQLDPANSQAITLLAQLQKDRPALEPDQRLKEGLSQAEILISAKRFDEAQSKLMDLQQAFPDAPVVSQMVQALNQRRMVAAAAPPPSRPTPAGPVRVPPRPTPVNEFTKSMALAEELRRSLQKPRTGETGLHSRPSVPVSPPAIPVAEAPMPSAPVAETSPSATAGGVSSATMLLHPSAKPQAPQASSPQIQVTPPAPPRVEPNTPVPAPLPPHVSPPPAVSTGRKLPKMLPMIVAAVVVLVVIVLVGAFLFLHHS
jgi:tetratricopeptide (TPR) repeat protein